MIVVVGVTFPLPAPAHAVSLEGARPCPPPCPCGDFARRAQLDGWPLDLGGLEEAVESFAGGDDVGRASALALLSRLVSGAFCGDATLVFASLCRAVDAATTGEEVVQSVKPSRPVDVTRVWGHAEWRELDEEVKSREMILRGED